MGDEIAAQTPVVMTVEQLETALEPIHAALGSIMESIMTLTRVITSLRQESTTVALPDAPKRTPAGTITPINTDQDKIELLKALINPKTGRFKGVYPVAGRFQARIGQTSIGYWDTAEEAALGRHAALQAVTPEAPALNEAKVAAPKNPLKLERERRKTALLLEQERAAARRAELMLKHEAKLRETELREAARLQQVAMREKIKKDGDLERIQLRGQVRQDVMKTRDDLHHQRKQQEAEDERATQEAIANGWYPGKPANPDAKTPEQLAAQMSDWPEDTPPSTDPDEN